MAGLIRREIVLKSGSKELITNAMDDIRDDLILFQTGNNFTDDGYIDFNLRIDILNSDEISKSLAKTLKSIANHWDCDFNEKKEFTTENTDRNQAIINLIQCTSAAIGYCWALAKIERKQKDD